MAVSLVGTGGLFTRLGRIGKIASIIRAYNAGTLPTEMNSLLAQFTGSDTINMIPGVAGQVPTWQVGVEQPMGTLSPSASTIIQYMVSQDPTAAALAAPITLEGAIAAIISQMVATGQTVLQLTVGASSTPYTVNYGNGTLMLWTLDGTDTSLQNIIPESTNITCTSDATTGTTQGNEQFLFTGQPNGGDVWAWNWPTGSGATQALTAVNYTGNTLLADGSFGTVASSAFTYWPATTGSYGTDYVQSSAVFWPFPGNSNCLQLIGGTGVLVDLRQQFGNSTTGTSQVLQPLTSYSLNVFMRCDVIPAAGVVKYELINSSGTILTDANGNQNVVSVTCSTLTTSWIQTTIVFRTPRVLPSSYFLRIYESTNISAGSNVFVDNINLQAGVQLYTGGPFAQVLSGSTPWQVGDGFSASMSNSFGSSGSLDTWGVLSQRLFNMSSLGLQWPYGPASGGSTIPDSLIFSN